MLCTIQNAGLELTTAKRDASVPTRARIMVCAYNVAVGALLWGEISVKIMHTSTFIK